jgi:tRNA A-37 threonylcarbamoyl transferase component Bud32
MVYRTRLLLARRLAAIRLHCWEQAADMPQGWRRKRRRRWSSLMLALGNAYLGLLGVPVWALPTEQWLEWELVVARSLGRGARISHDRAGLEVPFVAGESLGEILRGNRPVDHKLRALAASAHALRRLHSRSVQAANADQWYLSHGDATCDNVIVNRTASSVAWIDFDMRHGWRVPAEERHADDLRALMFSSAAFLPSALHAKCVERVVAAYGESPAVATLRRRIERPSCPSVFHLAQGPLSYVNYTRLRECIVLCPT